jgi:selenocysteine-specific elongation factor
VRALTGIDTDRLEEEKRRGISIELGFAHLDLAPDLRVALIDVPGHEKFIKNMLAGVGGIDFVVFVVAADESIKPQTREHFDICRLLRIRGGVIALTKSDLVEADMLEVAKLEIIDFVKDSFLEGAAIVPVSAVTGQGLEDLRTEMMRLARAAMVRNASQNFRLPVDRSFVMPGFGTVVTGTVAAGSVRVEDEVQAYPGSQLLRIRGLQVHGKPVKQAIAGQRAALNVTGAEQQHLNRGMTLGSKGAFAPTALFDGAVELLSSAKALKNRAPVHFHSGTAEVQAEIRTLDHASTIEPGSTAFVRIVLSEPLLLVPGDRFIIRMFSPVVTIGGGEVLDCSPPRRSPRAALLTRARQLSAATMSDRIALLVSEAPEGIAVSALACRTGERVETLVRASPSTIHRFGEWWMHDEIVRSKLTTWKNQLDAFHRSHPLLPGSSKEELRSRGLRSAPSGVFEAMLALNKQIVTSGEFVRLASHHISMHTDERDASVRIEAAFQDAGLQVPPVVEVLKSCGVDPVRARALLQILLRDRKLVRVSEDLMFHGIAIESLKQALAGRKGQQFTVADFKDWTGVSRKYAIPLLEWLDRERITRREGDARIVL